MKSSLFIQKIKNRVAYSYNAYIKRDPVTLALRRWFQDKGDARLRLDYPLNKHSIVFDVGGYEGEWTAQIAQRYDPLIYIFEPIPIFYEKINQRFFGRSKIRTFNFGLLDKSCNESMYCSMDGSSLFRTADQRIIVQLKDIVTFVDSENINCIDLIKINIEGSEYPLLQHMLSTGLVKKCKNIQVQFHLISPDDPRRRQQIRAGLEQTHYLTYDYTFVWENWRRK